MNQSTPSTASVDDTIPSLADLDRVTWEQLSAALRQENDGFKTMTLATSTATGADIRTVVLRQVDESHKYLWFHTDARAEKVIQLEIHPVAALLFWDEKRQVQLRMIIETRLHTNDHVADEHWQNLWAGGRKSYLSERKPGTEQPAPYPGFPEHLGENLPEPAESEVGRPNFAVIECRVLTMEYLHLSRSGQTRARFQYEPGVKMTWVAP